MNKKISIVIGGLLTVMMLFGAATATTAYAQTNTPPATSTVQQAGPDSPRGLGQAELDAAAKVLGMTADELSAALEAGQTLEELATAAGVDIQDVLNAISAAHTEELRVRIESGVTDGTISQEKADWLLEGLEKGFLDEPSFGLGKGGPDGEHGHMPLTDEAIAAAAEVLGMTSAELTAALDAGTTLDELAEQTGVDVQTVRDAIHSAMPAPQGHRGQNGQQPPANGTPNGQG